LFFDFDFDFDFRFCFSILISILILIRHPERHKSQHVYKSPSRRTPLSFATHATRPSRAEALFVSGSAGTWRSAHPESHKLIVNGTHSPRPKNQATVILNEVKDPSFFSGSNAPTAFSGFAG
jgi:hypothetical protein